MKKIIFVFVFICLLMAACQSAVANPTGQTSTDPLPTTTALTDPTTVPSDPTTIPITTVSQEEAELEAFNELFKWMGPDRNPYYWTTGYEYSSPTEIMLINFFSGGFLGERERTDEEFEELLKLSKNPEALELTGEINRLPKDKMEADLQAVYGISLEDLPDSAFDGLYYLESTDCYYIHQSAPSVSAIRLPLLDVEHNSDGSVSLTYENDSDNFVITLKPNGDSYLVLSNLKAE